MATIQIYERNNQIYTRISSNNQSKEYNVDETKAILDRINMTELTNLKHINDNLIFTYQGIEFNIASYSKLSKYNCCNIFDKNIKEKVTNSKPIKKQPMIEFYERNNQIFTKITSNNQSKEYDKNETKAILDRINMQETSNLKYENDTISFIYQGMEFKFSNYSILKNYGSYNIFNKNLEQKLNFKKNNIEKIKQNKKTKVNRKKSNIINKVIAGVAIAITLMTGVHINNMINNNSNILLDTNSNTISSSYSSNKNFDFNINDNVKDLNENFNFNINDNIKGTDQKNQDEIVKSYVVENNTDTESAQTTKDITEANNEIASKISSTAIEKDTEKVKNTSMTTIEIPEYDDYSETVRENYGDILTKYANRYGVDPDIMIAIATQESGGNPNIDGGTSIGLTQLEKGPWISRGDIDVYNFETNSWETLNINADNISDVETNVAVRTAYFQEALRRYNGNITLAIFAGNGEGNVSKVLQAIADYYGMTTDEIVNTPSFTGWIDFADVMSNGDSNYINNILKRIKKDEDGVINLTCEIPPTENNDSYLTSINISTKANTNTRQ